MLGGTIEQAVRQAMTISGGAPSILVGSVVAVVFLVLSAVALGAAFLPPRLTRARA